MKFLKGGFFLARKGNSKREFNFFLLVAKFFSGFFYLKDKFSKYYGLLGCAKKLFRMHMAIKIYYPIKNLNFEFYLKLIFFKKGLLGGKERAHAEH